MKLWKGLSCAAVVLAAMNTVWLYGQQSRLPSMLPPEDYLGDSAALLVLRPRRRFGEPARRVVDVHG